MAGKKFVFLEDERPVFVPIWREVLMGCDWARLRASRVYYGVGVPRGDGAAVITIPGFMGHDIYLTEMNAWFRRIGYKCYPSGIGRNAECPDILIDKLLHTLTGAYADTGRSVHLVGHSLGGILARAAANFEPEMIASVTTLGSPFRGIRSHPGVMRTSKSVRKRIRERAHTRPAHKPLRPQCFSMDCNCPFAEAVRADVPEDIYTTAIYTKTDGIVDWNVCLTGDPNIDHEVAGTHCGLAWNPDVYRHLANRLPHAIKWHHRVDSKKPRTAGAPPAGALLA